MLYFDTKMHLGFVKIAIVDELLQYYFTSYSQVNAIDVVTGYKF